MRKVIVFLIVLFLFSSGCFAEQPEWIFDPYYGYDTADFICASGQGRSIKESDLNAKAGIAGFIRDSIEVSEYSYNYDDSVKSLSMLEGETSSRVKVDDIVGMEIDSRSLDNGMYYSHCILRKHPSLQYYQNQYHSIEDKLILLQRNIMNKQGSLSCVSDYYAYEDYWEKYISSICLINVLSDDENVLFNNTLIDAINLKDIALGSIEISINVQGDVNGQVYSSLKKIVQDYGLHVSRKESNNTVNACIYLEEYKSDPYYACRYTIEVSVSDDADILEYSKSGKEVKSTPSSARDKAVKSICKALDSEFRTKFSECFDS